MALDPLVNCLRLQCLLKGIEQVQGLVSPRCLLIFESYSAFLEPVHKRPHDTVGRLLLESFSGFYEPGSSW